jgi:hypothetical protein
MADKIFSDVLQFGGYFAEGALIVILVRGGRWRRLPGVFLYLISMLGIDALLRPLVLYRFGLNSPEYRLTYWLTNILLQLLLFLLVCTLFRSVSLQRPKLWDFLKVMLPSVFVLVVGFSIISLRHLGAAQPTHLGRLIFEFEQNLYFTCLVLNTGLYILIQQIRLEDDMLALIVCGLGVEFAGPAASMAFVVVTTGQSSFARIIMNHFEPICTLGMLLIWFHAIWRMPKSARGSKQGPPVQRSSPANIAGIAGIAAPELGTR